MRSGQSTFARREARARICVMGALRVAIDPLAKMVFCGH